MSIRKRGVKRSITKRFTCEAHREVPFANVARPRRVKAYRAVRSCLVGGGLSGHPAKGSTPGRSWLKTIGCVCCIRSRRAHNRCPTTAPVRSLAAVAAWRVRVREGGYGGRCGADGVWAPQVPVGGRCAGEHTKDGFRAVFGDVANRDRVRAPSPPPTAARGPSRKTGRPTVFAPSEARVRRNRHCHTGRARACSLQRHARFCGGLGDGGVTPYPWGYGVGKMIPGQSFTVS